MKYLAYALTTAATLVTVGFLLSGYPIVGQDAYFHLNNIAQYHKMLSEGVFLPRWATGTFSGFGSAEFYFYPPLCSFLGSIVHMTGLSIPWSMRVLLLLSIFGSILSCRWYLNLIYPSDRRYWFAAVFFVIAPYTFLDVIVRAAYGEVLSLPFIPLLFGAIEVARSSPNIKSRTSARAAILFCVSLSWILLASVPMFAVLIVLVPVYSIIRLWQVERWQVVPLLIGVILTLLCTSFYLLPVWQLQSLVHLHHVVEDSSFRSSVLANLSKSNPGTRTYVELLMLPLSIVAAILAFKKWKRNRNTIDLATGLVMTVIIVMHTPFFTSVLADQFGIFGIIQFPFRFYVFLSLAQSLLAVSPSGNRANNPILALSAAGVLGIGGMFFMQSRGAVEVPIEPQLSKSTYEHAPMQTSNDGRSVINYGLRHSRDPEIALDQKSDVTDTIYEYQTMGYVSSYSVRLSQGSIARFHRFYWPFWKANMADGRSLALSHDSNGVLIAKLPAGGYRFTIKLDTSDPERLGQWLSLFGILLLGLLLVSSLCLNRVSRTALN